MIQFNLLPDIKIQYLKAKRQERLVVVSSVLASVVALAVLVLLVMTVFVLQKKNLSDLNKDIKTNSAQLQSVPNLNKILTVQNQIGALTSLHDKKVVSSRLLDFLTQVTPASATITKLNVDFALNTMVIDGSASDVTNVTDTLKYTKYQTTADATQRNAFSDVVLQSFTIDSKGVTYEINLKFDPTIFSNTSDVQLKVPQITTSRAQAAVPTALFEQKAGQ